VIRSDNITGTAVSSRTPSTQATISSSDGIRSSSSRSMGQFPRSISRPRAPQLGAIPLLVGFALLIYGAERVGLLVCENPHGGVSSGSTHDAAAGMRGRPAHVEATDWRPVTCPSRYRPQKEQLLQSQLALEDVAFRQPPFALEIERRHDLAMEHDVAEVGRVFGNGVDHGVTKC